MTDKQIIIEDCPYFIGGNCQEYLDGVCENHKCDLKIIRELEQKLKRKEQEYEQIKNLFEGVQKSLEVEIEESDKWAQLETEARYALLKKEQECERLKKEKAEILERTGMIETLQDFTVKELEYMRRRQAQLKAENERLKKEIRLYNCIDKWGTEQCHCACRCLGNDFCDAAEEKMKNIKKTLANIKEIAKKTLNMVDYKTYFKRDNKSLKQEGFKALNEILQKISEVEDEM